MKATGSKMAPSKGVLGSNHSLTFGLFTQVSGSGPLGPLVFIYNLHSKGTSSLQFYMCMI